MTVSLSSLPLFITSALNLVMGLFYIYLYGRLALIIRERKPAYLVFALFNLTVGAYLAGFGIMLNSSQNLDQLYAANYLTVWMAQFAVILSLHLVKVYFQSRQFLDLKLIYGLAIAFMAAGTLLPQHFLHKAFFPTNSYLTGLEFGSLFIAWTVFILAVFLYMTGYLVYRIVQQWQDKNQRKTLVFLLAATLIWSLLGIFEALSILHIADLPPLSWLGSILIVVAFSVLLVRQIEGLYHNINHLYNQVIHDTLTGVYSRRFMEVRLGELLASLKRHDRTVYLGILDVDNFKHINDNYGHIVGDEVLKAVTRVLKGRLRPTDDVGRYGGDEFVYLLEEVKDGQDIFVIVDRIRDEVSQLKFSAPQGEFGVSCSFGATTINQATANKGCTLSDLVAKADEALYRSKMQGKNAVTILPFEV